MSDIVLTTFNARYIHTAFGLRYLYANLGELKSRSNIEEFTIHSRPLDVVEKLLNQQPKIIGFGVYIWNVSQIEQTVALLKQLAPEVIIVLGGPEVSHSPDLPDMVELVDYLIQGAGEMPFKKLCEQILSRNKPLTKIINGIDVPLNLLESPYPYYSDEDIHNRMIYVEASRGCPFKCEFCLSSLDKTSKPFALDKFLDEMDKLYVRGARNFKFIDRTFNLKVSTSVAILTFFLERLTDNLYLHFEVIPDNLPEKLKAIIQQFPQHSLQFEIGVQTFDATIQQLISRKQDNQKTCDNLLWLREHTQVYIHADLIFGLPGDTLENFAKSFDQLVTLKPHEIQLGILKRLRGAPINRHNDSYQLRYNFQPPYSILSTRNISFNTLQRVNRFSRYWDMIANSGRFFFTLPLILRQQSFDNFMLLSDAIFARTGSSWKISLKRLFILLYNYLSEIKTISNNELVFFLEQDYLCSGEKTPFDILINRVDKQRKIGIANKRQQKRLIE